MKLMVPDSADMMDFESCRFDFRIDTKNGLTPSKRKKTERKNANNFTLFKCKVCGCLFDSRPALLEHKICHNKFKCVFCDAGFTRQTWMMDHVALVHGMGEVSNHPHKPHKSSLTRTLAPKPMDADTGMTSVLSESDSESSLISPIPSPMISATTTANSDLPPMYSPILSAVSPGVPLLSPRLPDLLPLGVSLSHTLPPSHGMPMSPLSVGTIPPLFPGLSNPQLTSPSQLVPAVPTSLATSTPLQSIASNVSEVPCFFINVPILISSGNTMSSMSTGQAITSTCTTDTNVTTCTIAPTTTSATPASASLIPVNPFPRKDIPPKPVNLVPPPLILPQQRDILGPDDIRQSVNIAATMEVPKPEGVLSPTFDMLSVHTPGFTPAVSSFMPHLTEATMDQTEALDFSIKSDTKNIESDQKPLFSTGIKDPKDTLCTNKVDSDVVVDLSCHPSSNGICAEEDKTLMQQQYRDHNSSDKEADPQLQLKGAEKRKAPSKPIKRGSSFLDKMVNKLWQSKVPRSGDELDETEYMDNNGSVEVKETQPKSPMNTSLGRVYVLNQLPETPSPFEADQHTSSSNIKQEVVQKSNVNDKEMKVIPDSTLQSAAASIAGAVMSSTAEAPQKTVDDNSFCAIKFHTCRVCKQLFYTAEEMWEHAVTHEDFHKYRCNQCSYVTACHRELVNHKLLNHGLDMQKQGRHICNYPGCMRSYSEWRHLKEHQKAHEHSDNSILKANSSHEKSPSESLSGSPGKDGRLMCDYPGCYKTFKEWRHLKVHQTLHTGEKPLSCQLCSYACRHRSSMNWHMKSKHGLDKMKTQGNRTVYVDANRRVICGWSDEANREINYLREGIQGTQQSHGLDILKDIKPDMDSMSDYSSVLSDVQSPENGGQGEPSGSRQEGSTSMSVCSSRPPSCAPSENLSERSLMDDPHMLMLKMQSKPSEFPLNMSVQIEALSPKEQIVGEDGRIASKLAEYSEKLGNKLTIDLPQDNEYSMLADVQSPQYAPSTMASSVSSPEASYPAQPEGRTLVMTPVASASLGRDGSDHQASMMKFKLKYLVAPKFYPCQMCNENFENATNMWEHRLKMHRDTTRFHCDNCNFCTLQMSDLQGHMLSTHGKEMGGMKDHVCFICGKGYATKTGLNQHLLRHSEEGPPQFECPYESCTSKVHSKCALKNHIRRVHLKVPPKHQCPEESCDRRFESSSALRNHQILHTEQRPLVCNYNGCDKTFRETKHLKVHRMQHTDEKPINCHQCDYSCRQRNSMNWHMKSKHGCEKSVSPDGRTVVAKTLEPRLE